MPDGTVIQGVPEGTSKEEVRDKYLQQQAAQLRQEDYDSMSRGERFLVGAGKSFSDIKTGVQNLVGQETPDEDRAAADYEQVQDGWGTAGEIFGDVAATLPFGAAAATALPRATAAALAGETVGAGVVEGLQERSPAAGAQAAAITAATGYGLGKVLNRGSDAARELAEEGVQLTPGQRWGGITERIENFLGVVPGTAGGVRKLKERALQSWNEALRGAGKPQEAMKRIKDAFSAQYEDVFNGTMSIRPRLADDISDLQQRAIANLDDEVGERVLTLLDNANVSGEQSGRAMQSLYRQLGSESNKYGKAGDGYAADLLRTAQSSLRNNMPEVKRGILQQLDGDYAAFKVLEDATGKVSPARRQPSGTITPGELMTSAVRGRRGAAARGEALRQSEAAKAAEVLGPNYPSGGFAGFSADASPVAQAALIAANPTLGLGALAARGVAINRPVANMLTNPQLMSRAGALLSGMAGTQLSPMERQRLYAELMRGGPR